MLVLHSYCYPTGFLCLFRHEIKDKCCSKCELNSRHLLRLTVLSQSSASQFLSRHRRANSLLEETKTGNLERECIEELCNMEEAREIFENTPETVRAAVSLDMNVFFYEAHSTDPGLGFTSL